MSETLDSLKQSLKDAGWRFGKKPEYAGDYCNWYAWQPNRPDDWPDCECNDKPPSITLTPWSILLDGKPYERVEFTLCGEMHSRWFDLKLYSVNLNEAIATIPAATQQLGVAWKAIAAMEN